MPNFSKKLNFLKKISASERIKLPKDLYKSILLIVIQIKFNIKLFNNLSDILSSYLKDNIMRSLEINTEKLTKTAEILGFNNGLLSSKYLSKQEDNSQINTYSQAYRRHCSY